MKETLKAEYPIKRGVNAETEDHKEALYSCLSVTSSIMKNALIEKGCVPRKTFILKYPSDQIVPNNLKRHFIRGLFDGDGCISYSYSDKNNSYHIAFEIVGTFDIVNGVAEELFKEGIVEFPPNITPVKTIYSVEIYGKYNAMSIMKYLYDDACIFLERKHEKFVKISSLPIKVNHPIVFIKEKRCSICGDENSFRYMIWHGNDEYHNQILCNKHYGQLYQYGKIFDTIPYRKVKVICLNNKKIFDNKKEAAQWCGLTSTYGITLCLSGEQITSGKDPETGELLRWAEYTEDIDIDQLDNSDLFNFKNLYTRIRERPIYQLDLEEDIIINRFNSSCDAGKYLEKKNFSNITSCCKGRRNHAYGYRWAYCDEYDNKYQS